MIHIALVSVLFASTVSCSSGTFFGKGPAVNGSQKPAGREGGSTNHETTAQSIAEELDRMIAAIDSSVGNDAFIFSGYTFENFSDMFHDLRNEVESYPELLEPLVAEGEEHDADDDAIILQSLSEYSLDYRGLESEITESFELVTEVDPQAAADNFIVKTLQQLPNEKGIAYLSEIGQAWQKYQDPTQKKMGMFISLTAKAAELSTKTPEETTADIIKERAAKPKAK